MPKKRSVFSETVHRRRRACFTFKIFRQQQKPAQAAEKVMKKHFIFALTLFILTAALTSAQDEAYLIPRLIHVGDPAVLIVPLQPSAGDAADIVMTSGFPQNENIDIHRIILERRLSGGRLLIEFTAFVPGVLRLPDFEIGGERFPGLSVTVNSVIGAGSAPVLSGPASSLAMPGTAFLLYGSLFIFVFLLLLAVWFLFKGRVFLRELYKKYKRRLLFSSMKKTEKRLQKALLKGADKRLILDDISLKFREFLGVFTESNCLAMTAAEFADLPSGQFSPDFSLLSLGNFFRLCDEFRFSGADVSSQNIQRLLGDMRNFLVSFENGNKADAAKAEAA
jgi:hypothetical protein